MQKSNRQTWATKTGKRKLQSAFWRTHNPARYGLRHEEDSRKRYTSLLLKAFQLLTCYLLSATGTILRGRSWINIIIFTTFSQVFWKMLFLMLVHHAVGETMGGKERLGLHAVHRHIHTPCLGSFWDKSRIKTVTAASLSSHNLKLGKFCIA